MKRLLALALIMSAPMLMAQGVLTYPDVLYFKFNEGAGSSITNSAFPGGSLYSPVWENGTGGIWDTTSPVGSGSAMDFALITRLRTNYPTNLVGSFTIECWIRVNNPSPTGCGLNACPLNRLWGDYTSGMGLFRCYIGFYNEGANFLGGGLPALNSTTNPANNVVTDGNWHHIALVHDAAALTLTSYVDGNLDNQVATVGPGNTVGTANFHLGGQQGTGNPFNGAVDEFRWWGEARSQAQIQAGMNTELSLPIQASFSASLTSGPTPMLVAFNDLSTTTDPAGITSWLWDFGDGSPQSTLQNPCHVYTNPGLYSVSLTVSSGAGSDTSTLTNYINALAQDLVVASCGNGDLYIGAPPAPPVWQDGFLLVSTTISGPRGSGWFFGLYPDFNTWVGITYPAQLGNPLHFLTTANPNIFPNSAFSFPNGSFPTLAGVTLDTVCIYRDAAFNLLSVSSVSRVTF
jgi:PKD repeat protein